MIRRFLLALLRRYARRRSPDFVIGAGYLYRWYILPRNPICNIYYHLICGDDDDRALHTHPWVNCSILLSGSYWEHVADGMAVRRREGSITWRWPSTAHRLELMDGKPVISLFITGPRVREWGFWCKSRFVHWREFTAPDDSGQIGRGCD